jgi:hypothetical protein
MYTPFLSNNRSVQSVTILFPDNTSVELGTLNDALQELLDGIQVYFMIC